MFDKTIENVMNELIQLDIDATYAYSEALKVIKEKDIHDKLQSFKQDHHRHIKDLAALLKDIGGEPIKYSQDIKGYVIEGITFLRSITGTEGALKAMMTNEKITNKKYAEALEYKGLTQEVRSLISTNFHDEKAHLAYIHQKVTEYENETISA